MAYVCDLFTVALTPAHRFLNFLNICLHGRVSGQPSSTINKLSYRVQHFDISTRSIKQSETSRTSIFAYNGGHSSPWNTLFSRHPTIFNPAFVLMICRALDITITFQISSIISDCDKSEHYYLTLNIAAERLYKNIQIRNLPVINKWIKIKYRKRQVLCTIQLGSFFVHVRQTEYYGICSHHAMICVFCVGWQPLFAIRTPGQPRLVIPSSHSSQFIPDVTVRLLDEPYYYFKYYSENVRKNVSGPQSRQYMHEWIHVHTRLIVFWVDYAVGSGLSKCCHWTELHIWSNLNGLIWPYW